MVETFISYSRKDEEFVKRLVRDLRAAEAEIWLDVDSVEPGRSWEEQIEEALERVDRVVAVLSPNSVASSNCKDEWFAAREAKKRLIPILIQEAKVPLKLKRLHRVEFIIDYDTGLKQLAKALGLEIEAVPGETDIEVGPVEKPTTPEESIPDPPPVPQPPIDWVEIEAGSFTRGCPEEFIQRIEQKFHASASVFHTYPRRQEQLERFRISKTAVTNAQYQSFVQQTGHRSPEGWQSGAAPFGGEEAAVPVTGVSWQDAVDFAAWAGARLPTRAELEKACRGTDGRIYPWGDAFDAGRCNTAEGQRRKRSRGDELPGGASPYGVLDLVGNVWEWVDGGERGLKMTVGASFGSTGEIFGASFFDLSRSPDSRESDVGFRLADS